MTAKQELKKYPFEIKDVEPEINEELLKYFTGEKTRFLSVGPKNYIACSGFKNEAETIYMMPLKSSDIFVNSFPRSGTTWCQELVWLLQNDLNYAKAKTIPLIERYALIEISTNIHAETIKEFIQEEPNNMMRHGVANIMTTAGTAVFANMTSPRFAKTHLPLSLLPPDLLDTAKVVYVARDVRDVAVSWYHFNRLVRVIGYIGDFKTFWNFFIKDLIRYSPYFEHVKEAWAQRHHANMLFLFYEELIEDLPAAVRRVADFLGKKYNDEQFSGLCEHLTFETFKNNASLNSNEMFEIGLFKKGEQPFIRKGKRGGWRDYFDEEMRLQAEKWIENNLKDTDLRFPYRQ